MGSVMALRGAVLGLRGLSSFALAAAQQPSMDASMDEILLRRGE